MVTIDEINQDLKVVSGALSDVETLDLPWNEYELAGLSIEWSDICGRVRDLIQGMSLMTTEQKDKYFDLQVRFKAMSEKLKALDLENPFEQE